MDNQAKQGKTFNDLPLDVQERLLSRESIDINKEIAQKFAFSDKQRRFYLETLLKIYLQEIPLGQLEETLRALNLSPKKTQELALEILKKKVLPLSDYLKINVLSYIKDLGGEIPADEMSDLVKKETQGKIDADQVMKQIEQNTGLKLEDNVLRNRFKNIIISFLRNVRSPLETAIVLKRSPKIGGLGLSQEKADQVMNFLRSDSKKKNQGKNKEKKEVLVNQDSLLSRQKIVDSKKSKKLIEAPLATEELLRIETRSAQSLLEEKEKEENEEPKKEEVPSKNSVNDSIEEEKTSLISEDSSPNQEKVIEDIEKAMKNFASVSKESREEKGSQGVTPLKSKIEEERGKIKKKTHMEAEKNPVAEEDLNLSSLPFLEKSSRESQKEDREQVEGISPQPRIYGPTDQLKSISLVDWRRWGTPREAALKIEDKINLLAEDSLVKKAEGIKAWKESEVNRLYLEIGEESINKGQAVEEIVKSRQKAGEKTLSAEEFNAVVELNQKLRF